MRGPPGHEITEPVALARRFAALSGTFDPQSLVHVLGDASTNVVLGVTADLADACDTGSEGGGWLMRASARQREIDRWGSDDELDQAIEWRRALPLDDATEDLLDALAGAGSYAEDAVEETIAADAERQTLNRIAVALDRAGERAPAYGALEAVRSALGRLDVQERSEAMLRRGFYGRTAELAQIAEWLKQPATARPVTSLLISGLPGIGKSTLVDEAARRASSAEPPFLVVRLDFDRSALDVQDRVGLTMEISRQVSIAVGSEAATLQQARLVAAGATPTSGPDVKGEGREHVPDELSSILGGVVARAGRPILMLLDTMEVLRGRGETHPGRLLDCLDELCDRGLRPMAVIAAGRGDALDSAPDRIGRRIELEALDPADANAMLTRLEVPPTAFATINELAEGNPLVLRLAARVANEAGPEALTGAEGRREVAAAYLYRFLLSRIGDPKLRDLAEPGLVVRRINADVIAEVLAPALKLILQPGEAVTLFDALATHHWLVEPDPTPGWVRHRADIRTVLLRLLYEGRSRLTATRIDRAAAKWFARRTEPFAAMEAAYHELQAMRGGAEPPGIDPEVLRRLDKETIAELPEEAQDLIRTARGERTSKFRSDDPGSKPAPPENAAAASELEALLERGDIIEASFVYERAFAHQRLKSGSPEDDIARTFLWRAGRWREATRDLGRHRLRERGVETFYDRSPLCNLALLEMWAEFRFAQLVTAFEGDPSFAGYAVDVRMRGIKGSLANGALGFALLRAGTSLSSYASSIEDPIAAAATVWRYDANVTRGRDDKQVLDALALPASRFRSLVSPAPTAKTSGPRRKPRIPDPRRPAGAARLLATSTPYGSTAEAVRHLGQDGRVLSHLSSVDFELAETGAMPPSRAGDWSIAPAVSPEGSIDNIAALGLLAEWLGAAAFVLRHPDLRLIARSAELWRRATAGDWAYPSPPRHGESRWRRRPDATMSERIMQLLKANDPLATSQEQLRLWFGGERDAALEPADRIARRFPAAVREARARASDGGDAREAAESAATALLERKTPSGFIPPLAVLISLDRVKGRT
jgi:AAA ATPase domain